MKCFTYYVNFQKQLRISRIVTFSQCLHWACTCIMCVSEWTLYRPQYLLYKSHFFMNFWWVSQEVIKIWLICIFRMAAKIADLCSEQHIFMSAVHSFILWVSHFHIYLHLKICKFSLFAYSIWPPKWLIYAPNSIFTCLQATVFIALVSNFHMYLGLRSSFQICKFG